MNEDPDWADLEASEFMLWLGSALSIDRPGLAESQFAERLRRAYTRGALDALGRIGVVKRHNR